MYRLVLASCLICTLFASAVTPVQAQQRSSSGRIAFVSTRDGNGNGDIFVSDLAGDRVLNLTQDPAPDRHPSWSPDGSQIVFASRRNDNWDLYLMRADGSGLRRLTSDLGYEGEPEWSPDGKQIAFSAMREQNLDIYTLDLASNEQRRITDHESADSQPTWSPDGKRIAFTSWRDGNQEIYAVTLASGELQNLSVHPAPDYNPAFSPDGRKISYISDRDGSGNIHVVDLISGEQQNAGILNRSLRDATWISDGGMLAVGPASTIGSRFSVNQAVVVASVGMSVTVSLLSSPHAYAEPAWHPSASLPRFAADAQEGRVWTSIQTRVDLEEMPQGLEPLNGVRSGGRSYLAAAVMPSFVALRQAVIAESGHDFLSQLSEAARAVGFSSGTSSYTSWHKSGRAFDTLFDFRAGGRQVLYISPEVQSGRLFWRLYLRAARQDGSQGKPLTAPVFQVASREVLEPPAGYFVDFTALAAEHGWSRIAAQERDSFNWRDELLALEYWHFEQRTGLTWYEAMSAVYDQGTIERLFSLEALEAAGSNPNTAARLGLPWAPQPAPSAQPTTSSNPYAGYR
jgi:TolB protein